MDGIVNPGYQIHPLAPHPLQTSDSGMSNELWIAPDSWAVQQPEQSDGTMYSSIASGEDDGPVCDKYSIGVQDEWEERSKNACIRVFRPDKTFATLQVPLNTTTAEFMHRLAGKFFLQDLSKYKRALQPNEKPLMIQKRLLEQMGYTEQDKLEDVGREDNSYLLRYTFGSNLIHTIEEEGPPERYREVNFEGRNISTIPIFLYKYSSRISSLDLSKNLQIEIPLDFAESCHNIKKLILANNEHGTIPASVRTMHTLEHLNVSGNQLRDLNHIRLEELQRLTTFKAINNQFSSLPKAFSILNHLTILFISNNCLSEFPDVICEITSLAYLDISFNKMASLPDNIGDLVNLVGLFAIGNHFEGSLPASFAKMEKLVEIDIRQNRITELDILYLLPKLEVLLVDYNAVSVVSSQFTNLKKLSMFKNHLTQFNLESFGITTMLTELNLSCCKLSSLPSDLFFGMPCLETISLDSNTLNTLPASIGSLQKLIKLSVQNNVLDSLPAEISKLSLLRILDAQKNNLKVLPNEIWMCASLQILNCSSNLLESFPEPYTTPSIALRLPSAESYVNPTANNTAIDTYTGHGSSTPVPPGEYPSHAYPHLDDDSSVSSPNSALNAPPDFNPPSFFASPRNHPPPLSLSLRHLFLGDNRLTDDVWSPLSLFLELRTLNLSFNYLYDIPPEGLCHQHLYELYLSGNYLASLPADDIEKLTFLRVLALNGNKLQTLPAEIGKLRKLLVLDVGNNVLKYNISNWPYDWNWNWNLSLKYLNLSGNKRLEIKKNVPDQHSPKEKNMSDFSALKRLCVLGLMDITILGVSVPDDYQERRVRTSLSEVNNMGYGIADWLAPNNHISTWDLVMPRFRKNDDECLFGLFDGRKTISNGCKLTHFLYDSFKKHFIQEQAKTRNDDTIISALRRTFLSLEKELGSFTTDTSVGASAVVCYIARTKLYVANVGDCLAIISRNNGQAYEITQKHIPLNPSETSRISAAGGFVSKTGLLNNKIHVSRSFGYFDMIPAVNANPYVSTIELTEYDEFVIMASRGLWDRMSYQTAVDIARTEKDDLMAAAQKLRDFALSYGASDDLMVMIIGVGDLFDKRDKRLRNMRGNGSGRGGSGQDGSGMDDGSSMMVGKNKRRGKEEFLGDSTLARLEKEVLPPVNQLALVFTDIKSSTLLWETQPEDMRSAIKIHDAVMRRTLRTVGGYEVKTEGDAFMVCFQNITSALLWCFTVQIQLLEADWPTGILETEEGLEVVEKGVVLYRGLSVRMGIHWGTPVFERNPITNRMDYFGPVVNKASRICNAADGGQICVSSDVLAALRNIPGVFNEDKRSASEDVTSTFPTRPPSVPTDSSASISSVGGFSVNKDILQLKRLGFHVMELGERRLKGLETPEMLSFVYPKQLSGRMEVNKSEALVEPSLSLANKTPSNDLGDNSFEDQGEVSNTEGSGEQGRSRSTLSLSRPSIKPLGSGRGHSNRTIDPAFVCALSNLAVRLERLTSGRVIPTSAKSGGSSIELPNGSVEVKNPISPDQSLVFNVLDNHIKEDAGDEELLILMENFITRIENAVSTLYLQKVGRFAQVLEKLGEAIDMDPSYIMKALQMYAQVGGLNTRPS
ncbi:hypothetical protein J3Q64DRAFT_1657804 [Phycomyces blakesleeanus]|uniref:Adenylate cyclase n=1 Tax=Phycomyces blakesleeanus TaxID=4837 RepID=A0ABR3B357_PHYBL